MEDTDFQNIMFVNENNHLAHAITDDIMRGVYDIEFGNSHHVAQYMFKKLDAKTFEALAFEMEAQLRFAVREANGI